MRMSKQQFIQALLDRKTIQRNIAGQWLDFDLDDILGCEAYRVKPEPREIWVPAHQVLEWRLGEGSGYGHTYCAESRAACQANWPASDPVLFREVL